MSKQDDDGYPKKSLLSKQIEIRKIIIPVIFIGCLFGAFFGGTMFQSTISQSQIDELQSQIDGFEVVMNAPISADPPIDFLTGVINSTEIFGGNYKVTFIIPTEEEYFYSELIVSENIEKGEVVDLVKQIHINFYGDTLEQFVLRYAGTNKIIPIIEGM